MEVLVAYDVNTETAAGRKRLRKVAKICEGSGQRVQQSLFECVLAEGQYRLLVAHLERVIDPTTDSLRLYRLREPIAEFVEVVGRPVIHDIRGPLVL